MVRVDLTIWVDLVASTLPCEIIGKAGCSPSQCGFHRQIGYCGFHAEGGALTLSGRMWMFFLQFHKGIQKVAIVFLRVDLDFGISCKGSCV